MTLHRSHFIRLHSHEGAIVTLDEAAQTPARRWRWRWPLWFTWRCVLALVIGEITGLEIASHHWLGW